MVRKIIADNPDLTKNEVSLLNEEAQVGATTFKVQNSINFFTDDYVLIGLPGAEQAEVRQVSSVPDADSIVITTASNFAHQYEEPVIKLSWNQLRVYKSTDQGVSFALLDTVSIDYNSPTSTTEYQDDAGVETDYYQFTFYNSETTTETDRSGNITDTKIHGYITVEEFKAQTGVKVHDSLLQEAIIWGANQLKRELYSPCVYASKEQKNEHFIPLDGRLTFADADLSNTPIDAHDFYAYEEAPSLNNIPGARTDRTANITGIDIDRRVLSFDAVYPANSANQLVVIFHSTWEKLRFDDTPMTIAGRIRYMNITLKRLNRLFAVQYVFENVPFHTLQRGVSNWTLNGVSVPFDYDVMQKVQEDTRKKIYQLITDVEPVYTKYTSFRIPPAKSNRAVLGDFVSSLNYDYPMSKWGVRFQ